MISLLPKSLANFLKTIRRVLPELFKFILVFEIERAVSLYEPLVYEMSTGCQYQHLAQTEDMELEPGSGRKLNFKREYSMLNQSGGHVRERRESRP
jgi:hypothetical protein